MNNIVLVTSIMAATLIGGTGCTTVKSEKENEARIQQELQEYKPYHLIDYDVERNCWEAITQSEFKKKERYATNERLSKYENCVEQNISR